MNNLYFAAVFFLLFWVFLFQERRLLLRQIQVEVVSFSELE